MRGFMEAGAENDGNKTSPLGRTDACGSKQVGLSRFTATFLSISDQPAALVIHRIFAMATRMLDCILSHVPDFNGC